MSARFEVPTLSPATERHVELNPYRHRNGVRLSRFRSERVPTIEVARPDGTIVPKEVDDADNPGTA